MPGLTIVTDQCLLQGALSCQALLTYVVLHILYMVSNTSGTIGLGTGI